VTVTAAADSLLRRPRAPAVALTAFFLAGEAIGRSLEPGIGWSLSALLFVVTVALARSRRFLGSTAFVLLAFFFLGSATYRLAQDKASHQGLFELYKSLGQVAFQSPCLVDGRLRREPEHRSDQVVLLIDVERLVIGKKAWSSRGGLRASVHGAAEFRERLAGLRTGDSVRIWALLRRPRGFLNPGGFDVTAYQERNGLSLSASVKSALLVERTESASWWKSLGSRVRGFVRRRIEKAYEPLVGVDDEAPGMSIALLIGDRSRIPVWAGELYQKAGTFHVIAISGAHVGIFAWFLHGALRRMGLDQRPSLLVLLVILPLYAGLCGGRASVVRAVLMSLGVVGTKLLSLNAPGVNGLALSALLLLAFRPLDLEDPGFQLSFVATASIFGFTGPFSRWLAPRLGRMSPLVAVSLAAQIGIVPILAWHFGRLTPAAILANLAAMPLAAGLIIAGGVLVVVAPLPWVGAGVAWVNLILVKGLTLSSRLAVAVPGGSLRVTPPTWEWVCAYLLLLAAAVVLRGWWRKSMVVGLCLLVLRLVVGSMTPHSSSHLTFTAFDVGHGDALLLELPGGERILVDGGGSSSPSFDMGERVVVPALLHRGVKKLDAVIVTHPDLDHIGGLPALIENIRVKEIWEGRSEGRSRRSRELGAGARARGVRVRRLSTGDELRLGEVRIEVLSAGRLGSVMPTSSNESSLVLQLTFGRASILLTGDIGEEMETALLRSGRLSHADVLKVGHHGSNSSTRPQFLEAVSPRLAVVSARSSGLFSLPAAGVVRRLRRRGVTLLRTDRDGAVTIKLSREATIEIETYQTR